jgi:hypothetical protein
MHPEYIIAIIAIIAIFIIVIYVIHVRNNTIETNNEISNSNNNIKQPSNIKIIIAMQLNSDGTGLFSMGVITYPITNKNMEIDLNFSSGKNIPPTLGNIVSTLISFTIADNLITFISYTKDISTTYTTVLDTSSLTNGNVKNFNGTKFTANDYNNIIFTDVNDVKMITLSFVDISGNEIDFNQTKKSIGQR